MDRPHHSQPLHSHSSLYKEKLERGKKSLQNSCQGLFYRTDEMEREDESGARKQNSLATTVQERSNDWKGLHPKYSTKIWT